jgi:hypothetical protein
MSDLLFRLLRLLRALRQRHREHALLEACLDLVDIDAIGSYSQCRPRLNRTRFVKHEL